MTEPSVAPPAAAAPDPSDRLAALAADCVSDLTAAQGPNLTVIGAPGTGKTTLICRVFALLAERPHAGSDDVLVLTPNRDHASVLRDALSPVAGAIRSAPAARSIHSLAFGLVSARSGAEEGRAAQFVSGAQQDAFLADMLDGYASGRVAAPAWPAHLSEEVRRTRGFRDQLREALNEVMGRTLEPAEVLAAAQVHGRPEWRVLGEMMREYLEMNSLPGFTGVDTASVLTEASAILVEQRERGVHAGGRWDFSVPGRPGSGDDGQPVPRFVLIDAAQDLPDGALPVLRQLRLLGCRILLCASPDTTTQAFRGATGRLVRAVARRSGADNVLAGPGGHRVHVLDPTDPACRGRGGLADVWHRFAAGLPADQAYGHLPGPFAAGERSSRSPAGRQMPAGVLPTDGADDVAIGSPADGRIEVVSGPSADRPAPVETGAPGFAVFSSAAERTRGIARRLRTWHHADGYAWSQCAVLCRTAGTAAALRQELEHLGIPVAGSSLSLAADPATAPLLRLLTLTAEDDTALRSVARELLTGVYGGVDALAVRGVERELAVLTGSSEDALLNALRTKTADELPREVARIQHLLATAAQIEQEDPHTALWTLWEASGAAGRWGPIAAAAPTNPLNDRLDAVIRLMTLAERYSGADPMRPRAFGQMVLEQDFAQDSLARQQTGDMVVVDSPAGVAHADFACVVVADVNDGQWPNPKIRGSIFATADLCEVLDGGDILPGGPGEAQPAGEADAADRPRSAGDTRAVSGAPAAGAADPSGAVSGSAAEAARFAERRRGVIRDEARLLLAAVSRARRELLVTALDDGESSPSAFFTMLAQLSDIQSDDGQPAADSALGEASTASGTVTSTSGTGTTASGTGTTASGTVTTASGTVPEADSAAGEPAGQEAWQLSVRQIAARARARFEAAADPAAQRQWAGLLAALSAARIGEAEPTAWQQWNDVTSTGPIHADAETVVISPSSVEQLAACPLQWFLTQHAGASEQTQAQSTGILIHALAEEFPDGGLLEMQEAFEEKFAAMEFDSEWERIREHDAISAMVVNLSAYLRARRSEGELVGVEARVRATEEDPDRGGPWRISGRLDRVERDRATGGLYVIDFKTGAHTPLVKDMPEHTQLATYQAALAHPSGMVERADGSTETGAPAGAELVFLRKKSPTIRQQESLAAAEVDETGRTWADRLIAETAEQMRAAVFPATPSPEVCRYCRVRSACPAVANTDVEESAR